jgi:hypothetical protein
MNKFTTDAAACWFRKCKPGTAIVASGWRPGKILHFGQDHIEYENGPGAIPVAVVFDEETRGVVVTYAEFVTFATNPPGEKDKVQL